MSSRSRPSCSPTFPRFRTEPESAADPPRSLEWAGRKSRPLFLCVEGALPWWSRRSDFSFSCEEVFFGSVGGKMKSDLESFFNSVRAEPFPEDPVLMNRSALRVRGGSRLCSPLGRRCGPVAELRHPAGSGGDFASQPRRDTAPVRRSLARRRVELSLRPHAVGAGAGQSSRTPTTPGPTTRSCFPATAAARR